MITSMTPRLIWTGSGATSSITLSISSEPIVFNSTAELVIQQRVAASGEITTLAEGVDYTLTGGPVPDSDSSPATLTRIAGNLASGVKWAVLRSTPAAQTTDLAAGGPFSSSDVEAMMDRAAVMVQELREVIDRAAVINAFDRASGVSPLLPAPASLGYLRWNALASALESVIQVSAGEVSVSSYIATLLDDANAADARTTLGAFASNATLPIGQGGTGQTTAALAASAYAQLGAGFGDEVNIASDATVDLGTIATHNVQVTGTTTITSFGSSASTDTPLYLVKFGGAMTVTYNATSLVTPGLANYVTSAGDAMLVEYIGSGNWRVRAIWPRTPIGSLADNTDPNLTLSQVTIRNSSTGEVERATLSTIVAYEHIQTQAASASAQLDFALPTTEGFAHFEWIFSGIVPGTDNVAVTMLFSTDGGGTYHAGASDYAYGVTVAGNPAGTELAANATTFILIANTAGLVAGEFMSGRAKVYAPFNSAASKFAEVVTHMFSANGGEFVTYSGGGGFRANTLALTHVRFIMSSGTIASGTISMYGIRAS